MYQVEKLEEEQAKQKQQMQQDDEEEVWMACGHAAVCLQQWWIKFSENSEMF